MNYLIHWTHQLSAIEKTINSSTCVAFWEDLQIYLLRSLRWMTLFHLKPSNWSMACLFGSKVSRSCLWGKSRWAGTKNWFIGVLLFQQSLSPLLSLQVETTSLLPRLGGIDEQTSPALLSRPSPISERCRIGSSIFWVKFLSGAESIMFLARPWRRMGCCGLARSFVGIAINLDVVVIVMPQPNIVGNDSRALPGSCFCNKKRSEIG